MIRVRVFLSLEVLRCSHKLGRISSGMRRNSFRQSNGELQISRISFL